MNDAKIAMLIDAENAPARKINQVLDSLSKYGSVNIRRAYGNWESERLKSWKPQLHAHAIQPFQQYDLVKGKNAADMAITVAAMDILHTKAIDTFCIVSSDCDFTPLVMRILEEGKQVYGFGENKAADAFVNACTDFHFIDDVDNLNITKTPTELKCDTKLLNLLREAVREVQDEEGWAYLGQVGGKIKELSSDFDYKKLGFRTLGALFAEIGIFEVNRSGSDRCYIKDKKASLSPPIKAPL